ncbi:MAG: hypothetical protein WBC67_11930, partial [Candidatus Acidiferrales bacterium]
MKNSWAYFCLAAFLLQIGCGGTTSKPEVSSVTVSPSAVALGLGQPAQFQAMVSGSTGGVVWSVNGTTGGNATVGTIDANGNYTAPTNSQSVEVAITATSASDPSASATAQAYVVAPGTVAATANPQVALYTIAPPAAANVTIQFGPTTAYGKSTWTQTSPAGGGSVGTFVAGMLASTAYHMQATVQFPGGITFTDTDHAFTTGAVSMTGLPTITATTTAGMTPQSGVELVDLTTIPVVVTDLAGRILWKYTPSISIASGNLVNPIKLL